MKLGKCKKCGKFTLLEKHSLIGGHQPPFVYLCKFCHGVEHGITHNKKKHNKKYAKGTKRMHKKGWRK